MNKEGIVALLFQLFDIKDRISIIYRNHRNLDINIDISILARIIRELQRLIYELEDILNKERL